MGQIHSQTSSSENSNSVFQSQASQFLIRSITFSTNHSNSDLNHPQTVTPFLEISQDPKSLQLQLHQLQPQPSISFIPDPDQVLSHQNNSLHLIHTHSLLKIDYHQNLHLDFSIQTNSLTQLTPLSFIITDSHHGLQKVLTRDRRLDPNVDFIFTLSFWFSKFILFISLTSFFFSSHSSPIDQTLSFFLTLIHLLPLPTSSHQIILSLNISPSPGHSHLRLTVYGSPQLAIEHLWPLSHSILTQTNSILSPPSASSFNRSSILTNLSHPLRSIISRDLALSFA